MHVVHYLQRVRLEDGGVVRAVLDMCQVLASRDTHVTLLTTDAKDVPTEWLSASAGAPRIVTVDAPLKWGTFSKALLTRIRTLWQEMDVLHLHTPWDISNVPLAKLSRDARKPYIITVHGMLDDWCMSQRRLKKQIYLMLRGKQLLNHAAYVHTTAEAEMQQAQKWFSGESIVIPLVFDTQRFQSLPGPALAFKSLGCLADDKPNILFLSRLHIKKGPELLIDALSLLRKRGQSVNLILAGPGEASYVATLRARVNQLNLQDDVHFPGMISGDVKLSLYQAADVFVLPSSQENFGLVLPEAMACATPVVTTRGVDIWRELETGGAVIVDQSAEAVADAVDRLLSDDSRRSELGEKGRAFVFDWLNPENVAARYEEAYRSTLSR